MIPHTVLITYDVACSPGQSDVELLLLYIQASRHSAIDIVNHIESISIILPCGSKNALRDADHCNPPHMLKVAKFSLG